MLPGADALYDSSAVAHDTRWDLPLPGLGATLEHVVVNDAREGTFFARLLLGMENELGRKLVEIDARPSDSIVLALQQKRPLYVAQAVFDGVEDARMAHELVDGR